MLGIGINTGGRIGGSSGPSSVDINIYFDGILVDTQTSNDIQNEVVNLIWL